MSKISARSVERLAFADESRFLMLVENLWRGRAIADQRPRVELTFHQLHVLVGGLKNALADTLAFDRLFEVYCADESVDSFKNAPLLPGSLADRIAYAGPEALTPSELVDLAIQPVNLIEIKELRRGNYVVSEQIKCFQVTSILMSGQDRR